MWAPHGLFFFLNTYSQQLCCFAQAGISSDISWAWKGGWPFFFASPLFSSPGNTVTPCQQTTKLHLPSFFLKDTIGFQGVNVLRYYLNSHHVDFHVASSVWESPTNLGRWFLDAWIFALGMGHARDCQTHQCLCHCVGKLERMKVETACLILGIVIWMWDGKQSHDSIQLHMNWAAVQLFVAWSSNLGPPKNGYSRLLVY